MRPKSSSILGWRRADRCPPASSMSVTTAFTTMRSTCQHHEHQVSVQWIHYQPPPPPCPSSPPSPRCAAPASIMNIRCLCNEHIINPLPLHVRRHRLHHDAQHLPASWTSGVCAMNTLSTPSPSMSVVTAFTTMRSTCQHHEHQVSVQWIHYQPPPPPCVVTAFTATCTYRQHVHRVTVSFQWIFEFVLLHTQANTLPIIEHAWIIYKKVSMAVFHLRFKVYVFVLLAFSLVTWSSYLSFFKQKINKLWLTLRSVMIS